VTFAAILLTDFGVVMLDLVDRAQGDLWLGIIVVVGAPVISAAICFSWLAKRLQRRGLLHPGVGPHFFRAGPVYVVAILLAVYYWIGHRYPDFWMVRHLLMVSFLVAVTAVTVDAVVAWIGARGLEPEPATADIHSRQGFHTPPTVPWREDHDQTA
jgi:hypothetical protein